MKILYFTREYSVHDYRFLAALAKTENQVFYLTLERHKAMPFIAHQSSSEFSSVEEQPLPEGVKRFCFSDLPMLLADLKEIISEISPDLIQAGPLHLPAYLVAMTGFQPLVSMSWGYDLLYDAPRDPEAQRAIQYTLEHSAAMVGDCNTIRQLAISYGMPDERIVTFPWGIDLQHFSPTTHSATEKFTLLSTRGWESIYGVDVLARGFAQAALGHPELRLVMLGKGSQAATLRRIFSEAGVEGQVCFPGQIGYALLPDYYRSADLYISASHSDGTSISLLEALACGAPALVSDIPGNREWIEPGIQGWWFRDGDSDNLAQAIIHALNHRDDLPAMSIAARSLAEQRADWNKNFPELFKAYHIAVQENKLPNIAQAMPGRSMPAFIAPNTIAIIQARMSSSRLPGKVLLEIAGQPMLVHVVERARLAKTIDQVVIATTTDPSDDQLAALCAERGYTCFRGSHYDVLDRYYKAARQYQADIIVRVTADCPLIDPVVIDKTVIEFIAGQYDFAANRLPPPWGRTYPIGLDIEVCSFAGLELAWKEAVLPHQREHVMPFFYDQPERFRILLVNHEQDFGSLRWTVDTPADLELVRQIFSHFPDREDFSWLEVLSLFEREPDLSAINAQVTAKDYRQVDERRT